MVLKSIKIVYLQEYGDKISSKLYDLHKSKIHKFLELGGSVFGSASLPRHLARPGAKHPQKNFQVIIK
jgi:hypothetical protein